MICRLVTLDHFLVYLSSKFNSPTWYHRATIPPSPHVQPPISRLASYHRSLSGWLRHQTSNTTKIHAQKANNSALHWIECHR
ncbi:hypothetical protein CC78DRAFT_228975 [Lojkania enalia]|uniref:Uncharacterized protein n=1 Tax=Lojkania enalia TaxID=147567 RepID=A0A9P4KBB2_9PLEO|nr:hypothetical protein CC78DRAFT_228975 [Didymosphaeria enalia]